MAEFYSSASRIIEKILQKKGTPKALVIENNKIRNKKKLYAVVCEAMKYKSVTDKLLEETKLLSMEKQLKYAMAIVLIYDFMFGRGLQVGGQLKQVINRNKTSLQAALARMKVKAKVVNNEDLLPQNIQEQQVEEQIPRYVRVNTLKTSTDEVITWFSKNGFKLWRGEHGILDSIQMASGTFSVDEHIPNVLAFAPGTDLHDNSLYKEGKIILQDKCKHSMGWKNMRKNAVPDYGVKRLMFYTTASCFPAFVLNPPPGSDVIDACAAPGNKTSHLASVMDNKGKIFAFDISEKRITTMTKLLERAGETIVEAKHEDFLKANPSDPVYTNVQYILVDPSCSGSGMINRLDYATSDNDRMDEKEKQRVYSLAQFQVMVLSHALCFPNVKRVVFSTCSLHDMENEEVVKKCLEKFHKKFELKMALPAWPYRGHPLFAEASKCVRASPKEGSTSGFFLALFEARNSERVFKGGKHQENGVHKDTSEVKSSLRKGQYVFSTKKTFEVVEGPKGNTNPETNLTKRKRQCIRDNAEKARRITQLKRIQLIRTHRKCSSKEFENRLKSLQKRKHKKKGYRIVSQD